MTAPSSEVLARVAEFAQLGPSAPAGTEERLEALADIPITLTARLGQATLSIGDVLKLGPGSTISLDREVRHPVDLVVGGKVFARGEVVVVDDRFAVRIKELAVSRTVGGGR